jgi:Mg2+/Co2+ transporter CorB
MPPRVIRPKAEIAAWLLVEAIGLPTVTIPSIAWARYTGGAWGIVIAVAVVAIVVLAAVPILPKASAPARSPDR